MISASDPWHQKRDGNRSAEDNNQSKAEEEISTSIGDLSDDKGNTNKSAEDEKIEKFVRIFILVKI